MLQYVKNVEKELDDISDWRYINPKMQEKGYLRTFLEDKPVCEYCGKGYTREKTPGAYV